MKRILLFLVLGFTVISCQNKELGFIPYDAAANVHVRINWTSGLTPPVDDGMRINIFSLDEGVGNYGMDDVDCHGCTVGLSYGARYRTFAYTYLGNNIYFRNQLDIDLAEAYCAPMTRSTYTRTYPNETTVSDPQGNFYLGDNPGYTVLEDVADQYIDVDPENRLYTYTFEVRNVEGAEFIYETRGAISGMSSSFFLSTRALSTYPSTILFNATVNTADKKITGSFRTFGRLDTNNNFTIEILYPSNTNGIMQFTWEVTDQIEDGTNYHIIIDNSGIVVPDEGGELNSGWDVTLNDWNSQTVDLE